MAIQLEKKSISINTITSWENFNSLKDQWNELITISDTNNLFLTWDWINCWRICNPHIQSPYIITITYNNSLIAIAPLYIQKYRLFGFCNYKALQVLGDNGVGSEYSNLIVNSNYGNLRDIFFKHLHETNHIWDFIWIKNIASWNTGGQDLLNCIERENLKVNLREVEFAITQLDDIPMDILPLLSKSLRTNIKQTRTRLNKSSQWYISQVTDQNQLSEKLETLFNLHNMRWAEVGITGSFAKRPMMKHFYHCYAPIALEKKQLKLFELVIDGETQAMQYGYVYNKQFLAIQEGFNPKLLPGIGQLLRYYSFSTCLEEKLNSYDFLGIYTDHKRRWLAKRRVGHNVFIWNKKLKNAPFSFKPIWPTGRYLNAVIEKKATN